MQNSLLQWFASKFLDRTLQPRELLTARKFVYGALILLLFGVSFFWRHYMVEAQANDLAVREESRGELELSGSVLRLSLTGLRGLATCALWISARDAQEKNQWSELEYQVRWLTKLQPHFITPWLFQSWNLSYNVSVESDRVFDKYFYVARGIQLLAEGERQNRDHPDIRFSIGFYTQHKICLSDETNVQRSLFQLSCIPPNERDPARFRPLYGFPDRSLNSLLAAKMPQAVLTKLEPLKKKELSREQFLDELTRLLDPKELEQYRDLLAVLTKLEPLKKKGLSREQFLDELTRLLDSKELEKYQDLLLKHAQLGKINWVEFEKFCKEHPQLVRRLREGLRRETKMEQERQFTCERPEDVVQFLRDNWRVPSLYEDVPPTPADSPWRADRQDKKRPLEDRYPVLPPPRTPVPPQHLFEPAYDFKELTNESPLGDDINAYAVARAWYCYGQEPIPDPDEMPGFTKEVTDRAHQRKPRHMTTLIFRGYPALTQSHLCELLQQEGWFDETPWRIPGWFQEQGDQFSDGSPAEIKIARQYTTATAWPDAVRMWRKHGESNHLLFRSVEEEANMHRLAEKYLSKKGLAVGSHPGGEKMVDLRLPALERDRRQRIEYNRFLDSLPAGEREEYKAARFLYEYNFYRGLTNFGHHYTRAVVEAEEPTVVARRLLHLAESYRLQGSLERALQTYNDPRAIPAWRDEVLSVKDLKKHKEFREDSFIQEQTYEIQLRYLDLLREPPWGNVIKQRLTDRFTGLAIGGQPARLAGGVLVPEYLSLAWVNYLNPPGTLYMFKGPFDILIPAEGPKGPNELVGSLFQGTAPLGPGPLLSACSVAQPAFKPLLNPSVVRMVQERKGLVSSKPPPRPEEAKPRRPQ